MKHYVVFVGRNTGVFQDWKYTEWQIKGFKGAIYKAFESKAIAEAEFAKFNKQAGEKGSPNIAYPAPSAGIACDSSYSTKTKVLEYRVVNISDKAELYRKSFDTDFAANSFGEFFGLVRAVKYVIDNSLQTVIYCDSTTAIKWVVDKKINSKINCPILLGLAQKAVEYLQGIEKMPTVAKWQTKLWGEIPADFNRKH